MNQNETNQAEWRKPTNWSGPKWAAVYFSKQDTRTLVPKKLPWMGWTVNLGQTAGVFWLMGTLVGLPLLVILTVVISGS